jgi:hypothetical protein
MVALSGNSHHQYNKEEAITITISLDSFENQGAVVPLWNVLVRIGCCVQFYPHKTKDMMK